MKVFSPNSVSINLVTVSAMVTVMSSPPSISAFVTCTTKPSQSTTTALKYVNDVEYKLTKGPFILLAPPSADTVASSNAAGRHDNVLGRIIPPEDAEGIAASSAAAAVKTPAEVMDMQVEEEAATVSSTTSLMEEKVWMMEEELDGDAVAMNGDVVVITNVETFSTNNVGSVETKTLNELESTESKSIIDYAVDAASFPPNKEDSWVDRPVERHQLILTHNAMKTEVRGMIVALDEMAHRLESATVRDDGTSLPEWLIQSVSEWWEDHLIHSNHHSTAKDKFLKPFLSERFDWPLEYYPQQEEEEGAERIAVGAAIQSLHINDSCTLAAVRTALNAYEAKLYNQFTAEEESIMPLMRAYFDPEETRPTFVQMLEGAPDNAHGALIYAMDSEGNLFRSQFMPERNIPGIAWHMAFKKRLDSYKTGMLAKVEAIKNGQHKPTKSSSSRWFGSM